MATETRTQTVRPRRDRNQDRVPYRFTVDQVLAMARAGIIPEDGTTELWDGVLYQVTKHETHNAIVGTIGDLLRPLVPETYHLREEKSARRGDDSLPEPDLAVCKGRRRDYLPNLPTLEDLALVVEVNVSTYRSDHVEKFAGYAAAGVPVYWIVDVDERWVQVWEGPVRSEKGPAEYTRKTTYRPGEFIEVVMEGIRGKLSVAEIFAD